MLSGFLGISSPIKVGFPEGTRSTSSVLPPAALLPSWCLAFPVEHRLGSFPSCFFGNAEHRLGGVSAARNAKLELGVPRNAAALGNAEHRLGSSPSCFVAKLVLGVPRHSYQPNLTRQQIMHHSLLDLAGFGQFGFQRVDFGIHVGEDGGDGGLF